MVFKLGNENADLQQADLEWYLEQLFDSVPGKVRKILIVPPDITRINSMAGKLTELIYHRFKSQSVVHILPAIGTHIAMTDDELKVMFGTVPRECFYEHRWHKDSVHAGTLTDEMMSEWSGGLWDEPLPVHVNYRIKDPSYDLVLSIGQVVPHEVAGMANYTKNLLIGLGGPGFIHTSHYIGALYGIEKTLGQIDTPVRKILNNGFQQCLSNVPVLYLLTVVEPVGNSKLLRGLFCGDGNDVFDQAASLSQKVNIFPLDRPVRKAVVYLDPAEYRSTWLGNKAIYRMRLAMADQGELIILAPGLRQLGEDPVINELIHQFGYCGKHEVLKKVDAQPSLRANLSAAAHLIHGSTEGRFTVVYCPSEGSPVNKSVIESIGYHYDSFEGMVRQYNPTNLQQGWNVVNGEEVYFVNNPGLGLWKLKETAGQIRH